MGNHFLILGHPRSATVYTATVLRRIGLHVGHEMDEAYIHKQFKKNTVLDGVVTGLFRRVKPEWSSYDVILHQVRHPLKVISSALRMMPQSVNNLFDVCGGSGKVVGRLHQVMWTWYLFTSMADEIAQLRYRVEDIKKAWPDILRLMKLNRNGFPMRISTTINTYPSRILTWSDLYECDEELAGCIQQRSEEYGYEESTT